MATQELSTRPQADQATLHTLLADLVQSAHGLTRLAAYSIGNSESPATWRTLSVLQRFGPMRLGALALHSRVSQPTMTKIVSGLVETDHIKRIADVDDARAWQIAITKKGATALDRWRDQLASALLPLFDELDNDDIEAMARTVAIVKTRLEINDSGISKTDGKGRN